MDEQTGGSVVLVSVRDTSALVSPIASGQRIKYTCVASSPHYIALGANTGGVYCFHRHDYSYIRILSHQEGGVSLIRFSPNEGHLAVVTGGGLVCLWELNLTGQGISKCVGACTVLKDGVIVDMVWDGRIGRVFFGDDQGRIAVTHLPKIFKKPDEILHSEKSIVQMDMYQDLLLVSTVTRCIILNVTTRAVVQVGKRPREGSFGACFNLRWAGKPPVVYSARPGSRLWEADVAGTVVSTLKLKELIDIPPSPLLGLTLETTPRPHPAPQSLHFPYLSILQQRYLVCLVPGNTLYLFLCASYKLALWTCALGPQDKVYCDGSELFILFEGGRKMGVVNVVDVSTSIQELSKLYLFEQVYQVMESYSDELMELLPHDHALLKTCLAAFSAPGVVLTQQLLNLQVTMETLKETVSSSDQEDDVRKGVASENFVIGPHGGGGGGSEEGDGRDGDSGGGGGDSGGGGGDSGGGGGDSGGGGGDSGGGGGDSSGGGGGSAVGEGVDVCKDGVLNLTARSGNPDTVCVTSSLSDVIVETPDFPMLTNNTFMEVELDSALIQEDWSLPSIVEVKEPAVSAVPLAQEVEGIVATMDGSDHQPAITDTKLIADNTSHSIQSTLSAGGVALSESSGGGGSPSNIFSLGGSNGPSPSSLEREAVAKRVLQMTQPQAVSHKGDDVIAVPIITRSGSTGSLKSKGRKKSRRKKISSPDDQHQSLVQVENHHHSLPVSPSNSTTPHPLLDIPETTDSLPFPDVGLPSFPPQISPSNSHTSSPYTSLPSTPPLAHTPPNSHSPNTTTVMTTGSGSEKDAESALGEQKRRTHRSASVDSSSIGGVSGIGGVSVALSKGQKVVRVSGALSKGQKVVRGFLSSLSSHTSSTNSLGGSHDLSFGHVTNSQPVMYRNSDILIPMATPITSPPSSAEEGHYADSLSPLITSPTHISPFEVGHTLETNAFITSTQDARERLCDPVVLCTPSLLKDELCTWLANLEIYTTHHQHSSDSPLPNGVWFYACYLATLCAELHIYSSSGNSAPQLTDLQTTPTTQSCDIDRVSCDSLDVFVERHFECMDLSRLRKMLSQQNWEMRRKCWHVLSNRLSLDHTLSSSLSSSLSDKDALALLFQFNKDNIPVTLNAFPWILPWEVALACNIDQSDSSGRQNYVSYISQLLGNVGQLDMLSEIFCSDPKLLQLSLQAVLDEENVDHTHLINKGQPKPWSHMTKWVESHCLECLIDICVTMVKEEDKQSAMDICRDRGYWFGVIRLLVAMGDKLNALQTIVTLGDYRLLTEIQSYGCLVRDVADWEIVLKHLTCQNEGSSVPDQSEVVPHSILNQSAKTTPTVTTATSAPEQAGVGVAWTDIVRCMLQSVDPNSGCGLLAGQPHLWGERELHRLLVSAASIRTQQRSLAHTLLEKVDRYLWSLRASAIGPHVRLALQADKEVEQVSRESSLPTSPLPLGPLAPLLPRLEEASAHWGTRTASITDSCNVCGLSLVSFSSEKQLGLVTFICGHVFHKCCVPEVACVTCFTKSNLNFSFDHTHKPLN